MTTYAQAIALRSTRARMVVKFAGVPAYFGTFVGAYDDGDTHGELAVDPVIIGNEISPGRLDLERNCITPTTATITLQNSSTVAAMFARRKSGQYLEAGILADDTSAQIDTNAGMQAGDILHIGAEAVQLSGVTGGGQVDFTPAATKRGVLGTVALEHPAGTVVADTARNWIGRKCVIDLGAWDGAAWVWAGPYRTMKVTASPTFSDGAWQVKLSDELGDVEFYRGFPETTVTRIAPTSTGAIPTPRAGSHVAVYLDDVLALLEPDDTTVQGFGVLFQAGSSKAAFTVLASVEASGYVLIHSAATDLMRPGGLTLTDWLAEQGIDISDDTTPLPCEITARAVYPMRSGHGGDSNPADIALRIMLSDIGDGAADADFDVLPGTAITDTKEQVRAGCGLTADQVDKASWLAAGEGSLPSVGFLLGASGVEGLGPFLSDDVCPMLGGYWYRNRAGEVSFKKYEPATIATAVAYTLDDDTLAIGDDNVMDDESAIVASVIVNSAWDYSEGKHRRRNVLNMAATLHLYRDTARTVEISSRMAGDSEAQLLSMLDEYTSRFGEGVELFNVTAHWGAHLIEPGDTLRLTATRVPNGDGVSTGYTAIYVEVLSVDPDFETGRVAMTVARRPEAKLIAPACYLAADLGGGAWTVGEMFSEHNASAEWAEGWLVQFMNPATGLFRSGTYTTSTLAGVSSHQLTFATPPTDLAVGDWVIFADYGTATDVTANTATGAGQTDHAFISSSGYNPTGSRDRWG